MILSKVNIGKDSSNTHKVQMRNIGRPLDQEEQSVMFTLSSSSGRVVSTSCSGRVVSTWLRPSPDPQTVTMTTEIRNNPKNMDRFEFLHKLTVSNS